jgi:putative transcriptional regulator
LIRHHPSEATLLTYATGALSEALAIVTATHVRQCPACSRSVALLESVGGALLDEVSPVPLAADALDRLLLRCDETVPAPLPVLNPGLQVPLDRVALGRWWPIGPGMRWRPLRTAGAAWGGLILIQPGKGLPRHGHGGLELTCVLSGSFADSAGQYEPGDLSEPETDHDQPLVVIGSRPCLCVLASEGLILRGILGLAQRLLGR